MITLNSERGFEKVESWDEILELPGFSKDVDPKKHELKEIIGNYIFKNFIPCGLATCHRPHGAGYVVTTKSGLVTNIGNGCGKTHFGVDFKQLSKVYDRSVTEFNNRLSVSAFVMRIPDLKESIEELRKSHKGADWINKTLGTLVHHNRGCPDIIVDTLIRMVRARDNTIETSRVATQQELEQIAIQQRKKVKELPKPQYVQDQIGVLEGLSALYPENNLRDIIVIALEQQIDELEKIDIDSADYNTVKYWAKWCSDFEQSFDHAQDIVQEGRKLLSHANLELLLPLATDLQDAKTYRSFIKQVA